MNIVIEKKNIPLPPRRSKTAGFIAAVAEMNVGDSFFYSPIDKSLCTFLTIARKRLGYKFTTQTLADGVRVWRTQ